jgi:hypothetical protein
MANVNLFLFILDLKTLSQLHHLLLIFKDFLCKIILQQLMNCLTLFLGRLLKRIELDLQGATILLKGLHLGRGYITLL